MKTPLFLVSALSAVLGASAQAAIVTWSGSGSDANWSTPGNWLGGSAPALSDATTDLRFVGTTGTTVNVEQPYSIGDIIFGPVTGTPKSTTDGAFTLSGSDLTIQGVTQGSSGTFAIYNNTDKIQTINNNVTINNSAALIGANTNTASLVLNGKITMGFASGNLQVVEAGFSSTNAIKFNGVISSGAGNGGLILSGNGGNLTSTIYLNAANTYTGSTLITSAAAYIGANAPIGAAGAFGSGSSNVILGVVNGLGGNESYTDVLTSAAVSIDRSFLLRQTTGSFERIVIGGATGNVSNYTGAIQISNGATAANPVTVTAATGGTVNFTGANAANGNIIYRESSATGTADTLTKIGGGTVTLQKQSNYQGATIIDGGVLSVNLLANGGAAGSALGTATNDAFNLLIQGGTLQYTGAATSTDRLFTIAPSGGTIDASGSGAVNFSNTGAIVTADAASRNGTLAANSNTVSFLTSAVGGAPDVADLKVGMLVVGTGIPDNTTITAVTMGATNGLPSITLSASATATTTTQLTFGFVDPTVVPTTLALTGSNVGNNTIAGALSNSAGGNPLQIVKNGSGTWVLSGANTYTGTTTINAGVLTFANAAALYSGNSANWTPSNIIVNTGGGFAVNVGGASDFSTTDVATLFANLSTVNNNGLKAGSLFGMDTTNAPGEVVYSGTITNSTGTGGGAVGFVKQGAGVLTLSASNSYTGVTKINGGVLKLGNTGALGASTGLTIATSGTMDLNGLNYTTAIAGTLSGGAITNSSATAATYVGGVAVIANSGINGTGDITLSGAVTAQNSSTLTKSGTNTLTLSGGVNNTSLAMTVNGGTVILNKSSSGGALRGTDGSLGLAMTGTNYGNALVINTGGTVKLGANDQIRSGDLLTGIVSITGGTFDLNGHYSTINGLRIGSTDGLTAGTLTDTTGGGYLIITGTGVDGASKISAYNGTVSAVLAGAAASFTKTTSGTVTLTAANTYAGLTTVSAGELDLNTTGATAIVSALTVTGGTAKLLQSNQIATNQNLTVSGGTFDIQGFNQTLNNVHLTGGTIAGSGGTLTGTSAYDMQAGTVSANLSGTAGLTKTTTGTVTLSGVNTYTGSTAVNAGILKLGSTSALGGSSLTVGASGTLDLNGQNYTTATLSNNLLGGLTNSSATAATWANSFTGDAVTGSTNHTASVTGVGNITLTGGYNAQRLAMNGTNTLTLAGSTSNAGTTLIANSGTVVLNNTLADGALRGLDAAGNVLTVNGGTVQLGHNEQIRSAVDLNTGIVSVYGGTFDINSFTETVNGLRIGDGVTMGSVISTGGAGSLIISGSTAGFGQNNIVGNSGTVSANLAGAGATFTKATSGTVTLSGSNSYTGATAVNAGTLNINGSIAASASTVNGGTLAGSGTTGAVTVAGGGTVAGTLHTGALMVQLNGVVSPGTTVGVLSAASATFQSGGSFTLQLNNDGGSGSAGVNWDKVAITGSLDISGLSSSNKFVLSLQTLVGTTPGLLGTFDQSVNHTWASIITTAGLTLPGTGFNSNLFSVNTSGFQNSFAGTFTVIQDPISSNNLDLLYTAIPEPGTWAMLAGGVGMLVMLQQARRRRA